MLAHEQQRFCESRLAHLSRDLEQARSDIQTMGMVVFNEVVAETDAPALLAQARTSPQQADIARQELFHRISPAYRRLQGKVVKQLHFHTSENHSFLRMHKPERFGDDLTSVRETVRLANAEQRIISGFEEGRVFNGFRVVFPLTYAGQHVGSVEVSSTSTTVLERIQKVMDVVVFAIQEDVVRSKVFDDYLEYYSPCMLAPGFLIESNDFVRDQKFGERIAKLVPDDRRDDVILAIRQIIDTGNTRGGASHVQGDDLALLVAYIPIFNAKNQPVAGVIGIEHSEVLAGLTTMGGRQEAAMIVGALALIACISAVATALYRSRAITAIMKHLVQTDRLTGLASRAKLLDRIDHAIARCHRLDTTCALLFFDFDRFKVVNDSLGHEAGDKLLCSISKRLTRHVRETDTVARLGGDEFVILLEDIESASDAHTVARRMLDECAKPHDIDGHQLVSTASIGLVTNVHSSQSTDEMLRDADAAMYQAKHGGRAQIVEFDQTMYEASVERLKLEVELREALQTEQLSLHYQPIIDIDSHTIVSVEALARWSHPQRGAISPGVFIPIAEDAGLIQDLGDWVIEHACRQLRQWRDNHAMPGHVTVSVNISKAQLVKTGFADQLLETIRSHGLTQRDLKIEITETTIIDNRAGVGDVLAELQRRGLTIMMDDFGTGHSSLSGLRDLPVGEIKIDQSFIRQTATSREGTAILASMLALADQLGRPTIAEGVETPDQIALLLDLGCKQAQGYHFSRPIPARDLEAWHRQRTDGPGPESAMVA